MVPELGFKERAIKIFVPHTQKPKIYPAFCLTRGGKNLVFTFFAHSRQFCNKFDPLKASLTRYELLFIPFWTLWNHFIPLSMKGPFIKEKSDFQKIPLHIHMSAKRHGALKMWNWLIWETHDCSPKRMLSLISKSICNEVQKIEKSFRIISIQLWWCWLLWWWCGVTYLGRVQVTHTSLSLPTHAG